MHERKRADMIGVGVGHKDSLHCFAIEQGQVWQGVAAFIDAHPGIDDDPLPAKLQRQATGAHAAGATEKDHAHADLFSFRTSQN